MQDRETGEDSGVSPGPGASAESGAGAGPGAGAAADTPLRRARHRRSRSSKLRWLVAVGAALLVLVVLGVVLWQGQPGAQRPSVTTVQGVEYVTNVDVTDEGGYVYVYLPVNADTETVVLEVTDEADNQLIRQFLDNLDTLVPGEHVVPLSGVNLHVIVDGIDGTDKGE